MTATAPNFADIAVALKLHANELAQRVEHNEFTAAKIGLSPIAAQLVIEQHRQQAELVGLAHSIIKGLIPVESAIRSLINDIGGAQ